MLNWLTRRSASKRKAEAIYGKVVAAARQPAFFGVGRVADTPEGRFEVVALHLFLVAERVKALRPDGQDVARAMIETFVTDMDDCMREMGVGDLTVPKRVKRAAAAFYERSGDYRAALAQSGQASKAALSAVLARDLLGPNADSAFAALLADYVRRSHDGLAGLTAGDMDSAGIAFATPPNT